MDLIDDLAVGLIQQQEGKGVQAATQLLGVLLVLHHDEEGAKGTVVPAQCVRVCVCACMSVCDCKYVYVKT